MEATLDRLPNQHSNTEITTTNSGNVVSSYEEGKGSSRNGSGYMVSEKSGDTELPYETSSHGGRVSYTSEIVNVLLEKRVGYEDLGRSSSTEENGITMHRKVKLTDLTGVSEKTAAQKFYCPNCKSCITEVLIGERESTPSTTPLLIPYKPEEHLTLPRPQPEEPLIIIPPLHQEIEEPVRCTSCFSLLSLAGDWIFRRPVPTEQVIITVQEEQTTRRDANNKRLEVIKSIVYGGLAEAIASLSIVASAASANTPILNIFVLALANLLGGLFVIGHNLWELKADQGASRYQEVLGNKENFIFHAPVAVLSFFIFGLVPPLVYGFSFPESEDSDLKIAAVAASSLLCIVLLAIGKAYIQKPPKKYIKTVLYYVVVGVGVAGVSYLAGDLIEKLVEKLGWFSSTVAGSTLPLISHQTITVRPAWGSW